MASILAIISAAAGLAGFAVATLPKLDQFRRDFKGTNLRKDWYQTQLDSVQTKLDNWRNLWCGQSAFSRQDYEYFWGATGYESVRTKIRLILAELSAIGRLLERKIDRALEAEMDLQWRQQRAWLRRDETTQMVESHASIIQRFTFAMFRGAELEERIKRLQEKVKDLESYSEEKFKNIQLSLPKNENIEATTLYHLTDRKEWMEKQEKIFEYLYSMSTKHTEMGWSLVFTVPGKELSFDHDPGFWTTFDLQKCPISGGDLGLASFYSANFKMAVSWYKNLSHNRSPGDPLRRGPYLRSRFAEPRRRDDDVRVALANAAVGIVHWTMLLWGTPWTDGICTCGLRFVTATLSDGSTQMAVTFQRGMVCDRDQFGDIVTNRARKALLLGISLAEFALTRPVRVEMTENGELIFFTWNNRGPEKELLDAVAARADRSYREAVWYCFNHDRKLMNNRDFRPHHFLLFQEKVVKL